MSVRTEGAPTPMDRLAIAFLNGVIALPTGAFLWLLLTVMPQPGDPWLPPQAIWWFAGAMSLLSLAVKSAFLVDFYVLCWRVIIRWLAP